MAVQVGSCAKHPTERVCGHNILHPESLALVDSSVYLQGKSLSSSEKCPNAPHRLLVVLIPGPWQVLMSSQTQWNSLHHDQNQD